MGLPLFSPDSAMMIDGGRLSWGGYVVVVSSFNKSSR